MVFLHRGLRTFSWTKVEKSETFALSEYTQEVKISDFLEFWFMKKLVDHDTENHLLVSIMEEELCMKSHRLKFKSPNESIQKSTK